MMKIVLIQKKNIRNLIIRGVYSVAYRISPDMQKVCIFISN